MTLNRVCVYCGSSDNVAREYLQAAESMGKVMAQRGIDLVYGGGGTGLMGALASTVLGEGGEVIGVIPDFFDTPQLAHQQLSQMIRVDNMHERKATMAQMADGFIALPGGFGTLDELFEIITWAQIGLHNHPIGILNVNGYFDPLMDFVDQAERNGFIYIEHKDLICAGADPGALLEAMSLYQPPANLHRWVDRRKEKP